jgi:hypothetical protein
MEEINIKANAKEVKEEKKEKIKTVEMIIIGLALGFVLTVSGFFVWNRNLENKKEIENLKNQVNALANQNGTKDLSNSNIENSDLASKTSSEYDSWKTYTNTDVGYSLQYPPDWILSETNGKSEVTNMMTKYITIDTPDKKYFLYFGLKRKADTFSISNRTGVGAGDEKNLGNIMVLNTSTDIKGLYYNEKLQEIFFGSIGQKNTADDKYIFGATFSSRGDTYSGDGIDPNLAYVETAKKILGTVKIIEKTLPTADNTFKTDCPSVLSDNDKATIEGWKTYNNKKYGYRFQYPDDWEIKTQQDDFVSISDRQDVAFQFRSDIMASIEYMGFKIDSKKTKKIACINAEETYLSGDTSENLDMKDEQMIFAQFEKKKVPHLVMFSYKNIGASLSSDLVEAFEIMLKTIEFSK